MPANKPKFYLTTPIYYTNGLPHIGHTYSTIVCDTIRRYKRMRGYDVVMTTGTDEHGVNVERSAKKAGVPESEFVAKMAAEWRALWDELGVQGDEFIRTTDLKHAHTVQWLFKQCRDNGFVYPGHYTGQYCIYDNAYVDVKPGENCPDCGRPTETVTEANFYFKLSAFQKPLLDWYAKHPDFIQPEARRNEVLSFVEGGLRDLSITRTSIRWGIPVPGEEPHVFYVWFDALTAYLSAVGGPQYEKTGFWPADIHLVGKEIIRFHAVYWPAFLMAAGLPLPKQIWAHGWLLMDSTKMSKSLGNVVRPRPIVHVLGMDALRYYLSARDRFRPGRQFQLRRARPALQQRSRQRTRQSRQPHRGDDREELRRQDSQAWRTCSRRTPRWQRKRRRRLVKFWSSTTSWDFLWHWKRSGR